MSQGKTQGKTTKTLVWILMAMLIFGLGGFGVTNLGGSIRSVGEVGGKDISVNAYARALQDELRAVEAQIGAPLPFAQAQMFGYDRMVLSRLGTTRAMDAENERLGISIGDENLRRELLAIPAFQGLDGSFDRDAYTFAIDQAGMNEREFEVSVREETARSLLQGAMVTGLSMPQPFADALVGYVAEERDFTWVQLGAENLETPITAPTEAEIRAYYDENIDQFMLPATRQITYAWLSPEMIIDSVEVDEDALRTLYDERHSEYIRPERRLVERLVFADSAAAEDALARLQRGETSFETLVTDRGLTLADVDMGDVTELELGDAGEAVFAATAGGFAGPAQTNLGPALFRVNAVLDAQETPFEDARAELREELAVDRARRVIDAQISDVDDLLAGGATLEELADETDMQIGTVDWHPAAEGGISGFEAFRATASVVADSDFPEVEGLADGGIFSLRLDGETEATPAPYEDVSADAAAAIVAARTSEALQEYVDGVIPQLETAGSFADMNFVATEESGIDRSGFIPGTPANFLETVFAMEIGDLRSLPTEGGLIVVRLTDVHAPNMEDAQISAIADSLNQQLAGALAQDIFEAYARHLQTEYPMVVNQQALNAVHAQFQ